MFSLSAWVDEKVCEEFKFKRSLIVEDYDEKKVFNVDETVLFFQTTPLIKILL